LVLGVCFVRRIDYKLKDLNERHTGARISRKRSQRRCQVVHREDQTVKITINVDCTAAEAREFIGLPDLRPLQAAWLAEVERRLIADMQKFSPEGIARTWLSGAGAEWLPNMFNALAAQAQSMEKDKKPGG
jgi:hypothetical protein